MNFSSYNMLHENNLRFLLLRSYRHPIGSLAMVSHAFGQLALSAYIYLIDRLNATALEFLERFFYDSKPKKF